MTFCPEPDPKDGLLAALCELGSEARTPAEFVAAIGENLGRSALKVERIFVGLQTNHPNSARGLTFGNAPGPTFALSNGRMVSQTGLAISIRRANTSTRPVGSIAFESSLKRRSGHAMSVPSFTLAATTTI
jgi:hypothetical protein